MYKKLLLFFLFFSTLSVLIPDKVDAHSCPSGYYTYKEYSTKYTVRYYTPSGPSQTSGTVTDRDLRSSDFSSSQQHDYKKEEDRAWVSYTHHVTPAKKDAKGKIIEEEKHDCKSSTGSYSFYTYNHYTQYLSPSISVSHSSGSKSAGYKEFKVTASGQNGLSSTGYFRSYFVNKVQVTVSTSKTYEDQAYPTVSCTKWYGYGVGYGGSVSCYNSVTLADDNSTSIRTLKYAYTENGHSDSATTQRVYVKNVAISGPDKVYTGLHHTYTCLATFHDGATKYVHSSSNTMSSSPYSYIGTTWYNKGWKEPDAASGSPKTHKPNSIYDFYSADNYSRTYTIKCVYYPDSYGNYAGYKANDNTKYEKSTTKSVSHIGIKQIDIDSSGYFPDGPDKYKYVAKVEKTQQRGGTVKDLKYLTGHWYDFRATLVYDDGTTRDITTAPEVYWTTYPWYTGMANYKTPDTYYSKMTRSGLSHRIAADGTNQIIVEYFHRSVPYGGNSANAYNNSYVSRNWLNLQAKQIAKLEIKDGAGYTIAPKKTVNVKDEVQYSAWITWTDGTREDWTKAVLWSGDYLLDSGNEISGKNGTHKGKYVFTFPGKNNKTTVSALFTDQVDTYKSGKITEDWDSVYDKIEVTINYDCAQAEGLVYGCPIPKGNWQTEPYKYFETNTGTKSQNFLPPPSAFGYEGTSWTDAKGEWRNEYPYYFDFDFNVSGVSQGTGRN